jgi:hypothetical protein
MAKEAVGFRQDADSATAFDTLRLISEPKARWRIWQGLRRVLRCLINARRTLTQIGVDNRNYHQLSQNETIFGVCGNSKSSLESDPVLSDIVSMPNALELACSGREPGDTQEWEKFVLQPPTISTRQIVRMPAFVARSEEVSKRPLLPQGFVASRIKYGSKRRPPECSSQGYPAAAPHRGQGTENNCLDVSSFILIRICCANTLP